MARHSQYHVHSTLTLNLLTFPYSMVKTYLFKMNYAN